MTTPLVALSEISEGVVNQATIHNTALRQIEAFTIRALSKDTTAPPGSPSEGHTYIIPAGATGVWSGKTNQLAAYIGGAWSYRTAFEGLGLWINDLDKQYVYNGSAWVDSGAGIGDVMIFKGVIDCSANPNYPAADAGNFYKVSVAGKIGGASGTDVQAGDSVYCITDGTVAGTQAAVGANWNIAQSDETVITAGALINGATSKATPVDADFVGLMDSAASNVLKKLSWANIKATLKTYFDTLYAPLSQPFDMAAFYPGIPTASAKVIRTPVARALSFAADFAGSYFTATDNATASTVFDVQKNDVSIGSVTIAIGTTTATFTTVGGTAKTFVAGDVLSIICPASPDATLANPGLVLVATR